VRRVILLAFIWGWSFLFIKVAVEGMTPSMVAFGRIGLGMVVMLGILRAKGQSLPRDRTLWRHFFVMGLAYSAVPFTLLAWGEQHITSALTSVLNASTPLFAAIASAVALSERLRRGQLFGLLLGFAGVAVAAGLGGDDVAGSSLVGVFAGLAASACYGFSFAYARRNLMDAPPLVAASGQLVAGAIWIAPLAIATSWSRGIDVEPHRLAAIGLLGVVGTGFAYVLNYQSIADIGATRASLVTYLVPIVAVTVGVVFLSEPFHLQLIVGGVLTVLGIALLQERLRLPRPLRPPRPPRPHTMAAPVLLLVALLALGACVDDTGGAVRPIETTGSCGAVVSEELAPDSLKHILPGAPEPAYPTDPPTSGPHRTGASTVVGVQSAPLDRPTQVGILEEGGILLQHKGLSADDRRRLERQAGGDVRVAPNDALPAPVVATAWQKKLVCQGLDVEALKQFVRDFASKGSTSH
jgi:drug/metabolite transporter (DMT)-like permease